MDQGTCKFRACEDQGKPDQKPTQSRVVKFDSKSDPKGVVLYLGSFSPSVW
jgi:hypothetical protein